MVGFDFPKRAFLSQSCIKNQKSIDYIIKKLLTKYKVTKDDIIKDADMDKLRSGDYLVRCFDAEIKLFEIQLTLPFGFTTHFVTNL